MENQCQIYTEEYKKIIKVINFRFPSNFKKLGIIGAISLLLFLVASKYLGVDSILVKDVCRSLILVSLLIASLSKEKIEDEYIAHVRSQSYVLSFVCAIAYAVFLPLIALPLDILITTITGDGVVGFHEVSSFEVMFNLVCFQLVFFAVLKRFGRA